MIIFDYWPIDPNGYFRHFLIGSFLALILRKQPFYLGLALIGSLAVGKELIDWLIRLTFFSPADVFFTLLTLIIMNLNRLSRIAFLFSILLFVGCSSIPKLGVPKEGVEETITVKENTHPGKPWRLIWNDNTNIYYQYTIDESWAYELGDDDQCDWNKLGGYSLHFRSNHINSAILSERYDRSGKVLFSPYFHENGPANWVSAECTDLGDEENIPEWNDNVLAVDIGSVIDVYWTINEDLNYTALTVISDDGGVLFWEKWWDEDFDKTREIGPWFGGNRKAPHDWIIKRKLISIE